MNKHTVNNRQTVWDIALQRYGSIEGVFDLLAANPALTDGLNANLMPGTVLRYTNNIADINIFNYYASKNIAPATGGDESLFTDYNWLLTEDGQPILTESNTPITIEEAPVLTEDGNDTITTEDNNNITL